MRIPEAGGGREHLLAQEGGDLGEVDIGALGAGHSHQREAVEREGLLLAVGEAGLDHVAAQRMQHACGKCVVRRAGPLKGAVALGQCALYGPPRPLPLLRLRHHQDDPIKG